MLYVMCRVLCYPFAYAIVWFRIFIPLMQRILNYSKLLLISVDKSGEDGDGSGEDSREPDQSDPNEESIRTCQANRKLQFMLESKVLLCVMKAPCVTCKTSISDVSNIQHRHSNIQYRDIATLHTTWHLALHAMSIVEICNVVEHTMSVYDTECRVFLCCIQYRNITESNKNHWTSNAVYKPEERQTPSAAQD